MDTLKLFKKTKPGLESYKQQFLVRNIIGNEYKAHDAEADCMALRHLLSQSTELDSTSKEEASFSIEYAMDYFQDNVRLEENLPSLKDELVTPEVITLGLAKKIAASGLTAQHLEKVYRDHGKEGIKKVFAEVVEGRPRINIGTMTIITSIANHFEVKHSKTVTLAQ